MMTSFVCFVGLLSVSALAVPSTFSVSVRTQGHAITCLSHLLQDPGHGFLKMLSDLRTAYRLGRAVQNILASDGDAGVRVGQCTFCVPSR